MGIYYLLPGMPEKPVFVATFTSICSNVHLDVAELIPRLGPCYPERQEIKYTASVSMLSCILRKPPLAPLKQMAVYRSDSIDQQNDPTASTCRVDPSITPLNLAFSKLQSIPIIVHDAVV